jgi:acetyltransferase
MSIHNLEKIFRPAAVAVIGASEKQGSIGWALMQNIIKGGYKGEIYPVNPRYTELFGFRCHESLSALERAVDLAVIATPIASVPGVVQECANGSIGGAVIISAGGKEVGERGREIEARIARIAQEGNVRLVGPNCLGIVSEDARLNASFAHHMPLPGRLAFVSQSGAICTAILDVSIKERIGFRYFVSVGSMLDVDFGDMVNYLGQDPEVSSIVLYVESLTNFRRFMSAARAVSRVKPIVVLKSGRSPAGARAATSHTGALAGADEVYDAAFKRAGVLRVQTIEELFDCAELMAKQPRPAGSGLAIITNSGGPGVMATDALATCGAEPAALSAETMARLNEILPPFWSHGNPIDILGDATVERFARTVEVCMEAPEIDGLLIMMAPVALSDPTAVAATLVGLLRRKRLSIFTVWLGAAQMEKGREIFNNAGIPTYETPERAIQAFMSMVTYAHNLELLQQVPPKLDHDLAFDQGAARRLIDDALARGDRTLTEMESKALLAAYGIPVNPTETAASPDEAAQTAKRIGYPVVMKIHSRAITHKSEAQGVVLDLRDDESVRESFIRIMERAAAYDPNADLLGVTIQPMLKHPEFELILGMKQDPDFGPVILFGMGGILTEVLKDRAIALPPLNRLLARHLMEETHVHRLLKGYRNRPPANLVLLEEILIRLAQLTIDFPEITELDINPLITLDDRACAVDARVVLEPSPVASPHHLVISPYPSHYEARVLTRGGLDVFVRPVKPEDAPLLIELFNALSPTTIYYRFFSPLKALPPDMLARFTQIDYDRDVCLVALATGGARERMLGVARFMSDPDVTKAEFAIVVGDPWQGKGVGAVLLEKCIDIARERSMRMIWGKVLPENTTMIGLGRKLGFNVSRDAETGAYELRIHL